MVEFLKVVLADTVIDFEKGIDDVAMAIEHERVEQLRQLQILYRPPRDLKDVLKRVNALKEELSILNDHLELEQLLAFFSGIGHFFLGLAL